MCLGQPSGVLAGRDHGCVFACAHIHLLTIMGAHVAGSTHIYASPTPGAGNVSGSDLRRRSGDGNRPLRTVEGSNLRGCSEQGWNRVWPCTRERERRERWEKREREGENMNVCTCPSLCMAGCTHIDLCGREFCIVLRLSWGAHLSPFDRLIYIYDMNAPSLEGV